MPLRNRAEGVYPYIIKSWTVTINGLSWPALLSFSYIKALICNICSTIKHQYTTVFQVVLCIYETLT